MMTDEEYNMLKEETINKLKELQGIGCDIEGCHSEADSILTDFLNKIGFNDIVVEYNKVEKWYA